MTARLWVTVAILLFAGLAGGCSGGVAWLDERERNDPLMAKARTKATAGDIDSAIRLYGKLLDIEPNVARAHLDVALLFDDYKKDYVRAIYHYQRYLELRPKTEKKDMIESRLRLAGQSFAATLFRPGRTPAPSEDIAEIKRENAALKEKVAQLERDLDASRHSKPPVPPPSPAPATPAPAGTHTVKAGESLASIASMYGVRKEAIVEANNLKNPNIIKTGQVLVIP